MSRLWAGAAIWQQSPLVQESNPPPLEYQHSTSQCHGKWSNYFQAPLYFLRAHAFQNQISNGYLPLSHRKSPDLDMIQVRRFFALPNLSRQCSTQLPTAGVDLDSAPQTDCRWHAMIAQDLDKCLGVRIARRLIGTIRDWVERNHIDMTEQPPPAAYPRQSPC